MIGHNNEVVNKEMSFMCVCVGGGGGGHCI